MYVKKFFFLNTKIIEKSINFQQPIQLQAHPLENFRGVIARQYSSRTFNNCFNYMPCCEQWAKDGQCQTEKAQMEWFCAAACGKCRPTYDVSNGI